MRYSLRHLAAAVFSTTLIAQGTFIVDAANGPGTDYTNLQAAVTAVPSGSTLVVRPGAYSSVTVTAKTLSILGSPGASVSNIFSIVGVLPMQRVAVRGIQLHPAPERAIEIINSSGAVTWDGDGSALNSVVVTNSQHWFGRPPTSTRLVSCR